LGTAYQKAISKIPGSVGASAQGKLDTSATEKRIQGLNDFALRKWNEQLPIVKTMPGANDPKTYYSYVKQFLNKYYRDQVTLKDLAAIPNPPAISTQGVENIINQATGKYLQKQAGFTAPAAAASSNRPQGGGKIAGQVSTTPGATQKRAKTQARKTEPAAPGSVPQPTVGDVAAPKVAAVPKTATPKAAVLPTAVPKVTAPKVAAPKVAAPASNYATIQQSITGLNKREKQKILTQLLSQLGTNVR
jgi:hypothetical protein